MSCLLLTLEQKYKERRQIIPSLNCLFVVFLIILIIIILRDVKAYLQTFDKLDLIEERKNRWEQKYRKIEIQITILLRYVHDECISNEMINNYLLPFLYSLETIDGHRRLDITSNIENSWIFWSKQ